MKIRMERSNDAFPVDKRGTSFHSGSCFTLIAELTQSQKHALSSVVPWFMNNLPEAYFRHVDAETQRSHIRALTSLRSENITAPEIMLTSKSKERHTFISSGKFGTAVVLDQIKALPQNTALHRLALYETADETLSINIYDVGAASYGLKKFVVGEGATAEEIEARDRIKEYAVELSRPASPVKLNMPPTPAKSLSQRECDTFMARCSSAFVTSQLPRLLHKQMCLYKRVVGTDSTAVDVESADDGFDWGLAEGVSGSVLVTVALPGVAPKAAVRRTLCLVDHHGLELHSAQMDTVDDPTASGPPYVTLLRVLLRAPRGSAELSSVQWEKFASDLRRLKWVDDPALKLAARDPTVPLAVAEVLFALGDLALSVLDHPLLSRSHVQERLQWADVLPHALEISRLLLARFAPSPTSETVFTAALDEAIGEVEVSISDEESRQLLRVLASAARCTIRTNAFIESRWALTLRLQPSFFDIALPPSPGLSNRPYGVFFCAGRHFNGYHVRFADIARGGLRVVMPPSHDAHQIESRRHFNECFSLAWAQQLKNKDIPEGGAKAVCLVYPVAGEDRAALMHGCVKKFTDGLLDLICPLNAPEVDTEVVSRASCQPSGGDAEGELVPLARCASRTGVMFSRGDDTCEGELLYLGPDENITPADINWIASRAAERGYAMPSAFISSKPRAGINHKEYGVTSEGVAVFLHEGLRAIGIDPRTQSFTVKLTGGPDGDVGGNMLRIMHREYGERVRVVGLADGSGCAEDPAGLPMDELMRLVRASLPISGIDASKLSPRGVLHLASTPKGAAARNSMHNRVVADAFVPAGGRPSTVNRTNWRDFLQPDGTPSARLIVEGANLFFTHEARAALFDACSLPIIKDSSANKCGVICSSMEIVACMLLPEDSFVQLKPVYVPQVLDRLRELARLEATMLFRERSQDPSQALPAVSERISHAILRIGRALDGALDELSPESRAALWPNVQEQLPAALHLDVPPSSLRSKLSWPYQKACLSSGLASRLVYREGLAFAEGLRDNQLASFALGYLRQEEHVRSLASMVASSGLSFAAEVETLLLRGGVRAAAQAAAAAATV